MQGSFNIFNIFNVIYGGVLSNYIAPRTHGNVFLRFCIVYCSQGNRKQPAYYLKQYKNAGKRFRVYGCLIYFYNFIVLFSDQLANIVKNVLKIIVVNKGKSKI